MVAGGTSDISQVSHSRASVKSCDPLLLDTQMASGFMYWRTGR